jgi:hypothetical protein
MKRTTLSIPADIIELFDSSTAQHRALAELAGRALDSEAAVLRALINIGRDAVRERLLEEQYNQAADNWSAEEEHWLAASERVTAELWREQ